MRNLYDWPSQIVPTAAIIIAPTNTIDGYISKSGFENNIPIAGARNQMRMTFGARPSNIGNMYSWLCTVGRGALFKCSVWNSPQLATNATIAANELAYAKGINFSTGVPFSSGYGFKYVPTIDLNADIVKGAITAEFDVSRHPRTLSYGHVFGLGRSTHIVKDIVTVGDIATVTFSPPARRAYTTALDPIVSLRPSMIGEIKDPNALINLFGPAGNFSPGAVTLNEVHDERFL